MRKRDLIKENARLIAEVNKLKGQLKYKDKRIFNLEQLCLEKDSYFIEMISDGLRRGSSLAAKHMADLKNIKKGN